MKVIGLGHYSRVGKDTLAAQVKELLPDKRVIIRSLAWKLKKVCHDLYGWAGLREPEFYDTEEGALYRDVMLELNGFKYTPVELWVKFGTDAVRRQVYEDTWVKSLLMDPPDCDVLIVPDVRFPNEVAAFRDLDAILVKVIRYRYGPKNTSADKALLGYGGWDYIAGGHTVDDLKQDAYRLAGWADGQEINQEAEHQKALLEMERQAIRSNQDVSS